MTLSNIQQQLHFLGITDVKREFVNVMSEAGKIATQETLNSIRIEVVKTSLYSVELRVYGSKVIQYIEKGRKARQVFPDYREPEIKARLERWMSAVGFGGTVEQLSWAIYWNPLDPVPITKPVLDSCLL